MRSVLRIAAMLALPALAAQACNRGGHDSSTDAGGGGAGAGDAGDAGACPTMATLAPVEALLTTRCAGASCHNSGPGGMFPPLAEGDPSSWVGLASHEVPSRQLVVPGHPEQSYLYMKVSGTPPNGALMPLGASMPIPEAAAIRDWIAAGAPTSCGVDGGAPATAVDPNSLDQNALFTCPAGAPPASSPARIRRIESPEWTYALPQTLNGFPHASAAHLNPFTALETQPYSTYAVGTTIDTSTLDLYFQVLPDAPGSWVADSLHLPSGAISLAGVDDDHMLDCMFGPSTKIEASPTDACIDTFVDRFLTMGVLARAPTSEEHARLRAFLVTALADEGGDVTKRPATLELVGEAAWLTLGALFRSETGSPTNDATHRNRLSNEELGLVVGGMLSFHRPGAPMIGNFYQFQTPDPDDGCHPWLHLVSQAVADGSIQDPATIKKLIATYGGGDDPGGQPLACQSSAVTVRRRDLTMEWLDADRAPRGEYWLAPRIADFFRQWLGYGGANSAFKDTPGLSSRFATTNVNDDPTTTGFGCLQSGCSHEPTLVAQLDDTIARTVLDAANDHQDVFKALMTTTKWRVSSDRVDSNGQACTSEKDCTDPMHPWCTAEGVCGNGNSTVTEARAYDLEGVPATDPGRWVDMPKTERSGVLTHPAWLTAIGDNFQDDPSLIHRGKWVREKLFCETVPGLELVMVAARLGPSSPNHTLSARDRVEQAIDDQKNADAGDGPTCWGCHRLMNSLGYPFEMYNHAGFLRAWDKYEADGTTPHPPDATSQILYAPDPALDVAVANAVDFAQHLANSPYARRCFIRQAFRYFMGRDETMADQCTLVAMENALDNGSFFDMLGVLASSDTVLYRTTGGQP